MDNFRKRRDDLGYSQPKLAEVADLSAQRICDFEVGRALPTTDQARRLETTLGIVGLPHQGEVLSERVVKRLSRARPFELPAVNAESWQRMERYYRNQLDALHVSEGDRQWIIRNLWADSGVDGLGVFSLVAAGARRCWGSPPGFGYRGHGVVDRNGQALGERLLPALHWVTEEFESVIWPQASLQNARGSYRVDYLALVKRVRRTFWRVAEVDGPLHDQDRDEYRSRLLQVTPFRVRDIDVIDLRFPEMLAKYFCGLR